MYTNISYILYIFFIFEVIGMSFKVKNAPCFRCCDRYVGCHSTCNKYIEFSDSRNVNRDVRLQEIDVDTYYNRKHISMRRRYS
mgnify:CR=1 FL=1